MKKNYKVGMQIIDLLMQSQMKQELSKDIMDLPIILNLKLKVDSKSKVESALGDSLVASSKFRRAHLISHYDYTGKLLKSLQIENFIDFTLVNDSSVVILTLNQEEKQLALTLWKLDTGKSESFAVSQAKTLPTSKCCMFVFKKTKMFCLCHFTKKHLQLFYFRLPFEVDDDPFHICTIPIQSISGLIKINEHSMIGLIPSEPSSLISFLTYSLKCNGIGGLLQHRFSQNQIKNHGNMDQENGYLKIKDIWQIKPTILYIQCVQYNAYRRAPEDENNMHYFTFYYNYLKNTMIKSRLTSLFPQPHRIQFINSLRMVNTVEEFIVENRIMPRNVPIYYVNPLNEEVVSKYMGEYHKFGLGNFSWPNFQNGSLLQYEYQFYSGSMNIKVRLYCPTWQGIKCISTFLLNQIIEYCDDDLIDGVCNLVSDEEQCEDPYKYLDKLNKKQSNSGKIIQARRIL